MPRGLDDPGRALGVFLEVLLGATFVVVLVGGILMIRGMDAGERSQGGPYYVGVVLLALLAAIARKVFAIRARRIPRRSRPWLP